MAVCTKRVALAAAAAFGLAASLFVAAPASAATQDENTTTMASAISVLSMAKICGFPLSDSQNGTVSTKAVNAAKELGLSDQDAGSAAQEIAKNLAEQKEQVCANGRGEYDSMLASLTGK